MTKVTQFRVRRLPSKKAVLDLRVEIGRGPRGPRYSGAPELGYLRGQQGGVHDAYRAIRRKYPEAARFLLKKFKMKPNGDIVL